MAITEDIVTTTPTVFTPPFYRKLGDLFIKFYADDKMLIVDKTTGYEKIYLDEFPNLDIVSVASTTASDVTEFGTEYAAVQVIHDAI